jgi:excisionase family DNA binding protein
MNMDESYAKDREENHLMMTVHELASYLRLSEAKVYRLANNGCIPSFRLGTSWRFRKDLIDEWTKKAILKVP